MDDFVWCIGAASRFRHGATDHYSRRAFDRVAGCESAAHALRLSRWSDRLRREASSWIDMAHVEYSDRPFFRVQSKSCAICPQRLTRGGSDRQRAESLRDKFDAIGGRFSPLTRIVGALGKPMEPTVVPPTPDRWSDLETIFNAKGYSIARGCWCMGYHPHQTGIAAVILKD